MFGNGMYLSVLYCLCYEMDVYTDMLEDQVLGREISGPE